MGFAQGQLFIRRPNIACAAQKLPFPFGHVLVSLLHFHPVKGGGDLALLLPDHQRIVLGIEPQHLVPRR